MDAYVPQPELSTNVHLVRRVDPYIVKDGLTDNYNAVISVFRDHPELQNHWILRNVVSQYVADRMPPPSSKDGQLNPARYYMNAQYYFLVPPLPTCDESHLDALLVQKDPMKTRNAWKYRYNPSIPNAGDQPVATSLSAGANQNPRGCARPQLCSKKTPTIHPQWSKIRRISSDLLRKSVTLEIVKNLIAHLEQNSPNEWCALHDVADKIHPQSVYRSPSRMTPTQRVCEYLHRCFKKNSWDVVADEFCHGLLIRRQSADIKTNVWEVRCNVPDIEHTSANRRREFADDDEDFDEYLYDATGDDCLPPAVRMINFDNIGKNQYAIWWTVELVNHLTDVYPIFNKWFPIEGDFRNALLAHERTWHETLMSLPAVDCDTRTNGTGIYVDTYYTVIKIQDPTRLPEWLITNIPRLQEHMAVRSADRLSRGEDYPVEDCQLDKTVNPRLVSSDQSPNPDGSDMATTHEATNQSDESQQPPNSTTQLDARIPPPSQSDNLQVPLIMGADPIERQGTDEPDPPLDFGKDFDLSHVFDSEFFPESQDGNLSLSMPFDLDLHPSFGGSILLDDDLANILYTSPTGKQDEVMQMPPYESSPVSQQQPAPETLHAQSPHPMSSASQLPGRSALDDPFGGLSAHPPPAPVGPSYTSQDSTDPKRKRNDDGSSPYDHSLKTFKRARTGNLLDNQDIIF